MKVAVTYEDGQVFQHFGHCENFKFYDIEENKVKSSEVISAIGSGHGALAGFLKSNGAEALICGGIGGGARTALAEAGITLFPGVVGDADESIEALLADKLDFDMNTVCNHHHADNHDCGEHHCGENKQGCAGH